MTGINDRILIEKRNRSLDDTSGFGKNLIAREVVLAVARGGVLTREVALEVARGGVLARYFAMIRFGTRPSSGATWFVS